MSSPGHLFTLWTDWKKTMRRNTFIKKMSVLLCCQALSLSLFAQQQKVDTAHIYSIPKSWYPTLSDAWSPFSSPLQVFNKEELKNLQALQVSDAVKHFAGVTVKDYGGIGGLKTVSIRSLGHNTPLFPTTHHRQRLPDRTSRHRTFLLKQRRPPFAQQRTKRQHLPACPFFCFCRYTEHTDTDSAFQRRQAD